MENRSPEPRPKHIVVSGPPVDPALMGDPALLPPPRRSGGFWILLIAGLVAVVGLLGALIWFAWTSV